MRVILDSSAVISLINEQDADHVRAVAVRDTAFVFDDQQLLPYEVLAETLNVLGRKLGRSYAASAARVLLGMHEDGEIRLIEPAAHIIRHAAEIQPTANGSPSFVDCLVMTYADEYSTPYIFGFDATFRKNGYLLPGESTEMEEAV
jgi:predicted nucleic acid-binding protein